MSADPAGTSGLFALVFTVAVACVALLRPPCRRWFGAGCAFQLWALVPLAVLASQLPHAATASSGTLSGVMVVISAATPRNSPMGAAVSDGHAGIGWIWFAGVLACLARAAWTQQRYAAGLRGAVPLAGIALPWPVLQAGSPRVGPALVGALRPRIILPADFLQRYDEEEQGLILAHEVMHARRRDGWWSLLAEVSASLLWFHPLAWWALAAIRHDQELACDAAVLRERRGCRRSYARAMLKTPIAVQALPVGCSWSSRHPLTERIAMLKSPSPSSARRRIGLFAGLALVGTLTGAVYATTAPVTPPGRPQAVTAGQYQLDIRLALSSNGAKTSHVERFKVALCMAPGEMATLVAHGVQLDATARALQQDRVRVDLAVHEKDGGELARTRLEGTLGQPLQASGAVPGIDQSYRLEVTPRRDCPASAADAGGAHAPVTMRVNHGTVRGVAAAIAAQAGLALANPRTLGDGPVSLEFHGIPGDRAMRLVAALGGADALFEGNRVRFEPK